MALRILGTTVLHQSQESRPRKAVGWPHHCCQPSPALHTSRPLHLLFPQPEMFFLPSPTPDTQPYRLLPLLLHSAYLHICLQPLHSGCGTQSVAETKQKVAKGYSTALFSEMHYKGYMPLIKYKIPHNRKPLPSWVSSLS